MPATWVYRGRSKTRSESAEFGWHVHAAMESWTSRADLKASILLALQGGAIFAVVTTDVFVRELMSSAQNAAVLAGLGLLVVALCLAAAAMLPVLGSSRRHRQERQTNFVYFGHVRLWPVDELARRLARPEQAEQNAMLAQQLVAMSRLNWHKHRMLQLSVLLSMAAILLLVGVGFVIRVSGGAGP